MIEKVEELLSSDDGKTLKDAVVCGFKNEHKLEKLKQIWPAYRPEEAPVGGMIKHASFIKIANCGCCVREQHERTMSPVKDKECQKMWQSRSFKSNKGNPS